MNRMSNGASKLGRSYVRTTTRQMIGVGKGLTYIGDTITKPAAAASAAAAALGQPEIAVPLASVAFVGGGMSAGGRGLMASGRVMRNTILKKQTLGEQKKHLDRLTESAKQGNDLFKKY